MVNDTYKTCDSQTIQQQTKNHSKGNIPKIVYLEYESLTTTKCHSFNKFNFLIFIFHINKKIV